MPWVRTRSSPYGELESAYVVSGYKTVGIYDKSRVPRTGAEIEEAAGRARSFFNERRAQRERDAQRPSYDTGIVIRDDYNS